MSQRIGTVDNLFIHACRKLFSRYKIQLYASHNEEDFHKKILNLNAHYIDYKTNIAGTGKQKTSSEASTVYEIYVKKKDHTLAELAMNTAAHR
ncbi:hypothetical protein J45TS6_07400 [Paenibacillus sp. J45TS6]|uniref:hypothetical protein n=1 Tax=Paenibacillus sp. J45TS6 TaxID=2807196 RepID=UPI001B07C89C|nr:hypothetical protein [Paenibacillus sp. J45TS6]GIP42281.1 hypothetical protein J45TS6_07400 [Paenibacillus sp. J45TS6]